MSAVIAIIVLVIGVGYIKLSQENVFSEKSSKREERFSSNEETSKKDKDSFSEIFNETFLALAAFVIKSDNDIDNSELERVKKYFKTFYPGNEFKYLKSLKHYLNKDVKINDTCNSIANAEFNDKFQMMVQLFNIASADNVIYISEYTALYDISVYLKLSTLTFMSLRGLFNVSFTHKEILDFKEQSFKQQMNDWNKEFEKEYRQRKEAQQRKENQKRREEEEKRRKHYRKEQKSYNYQQNNNNYRASNRTKSLSNLEIAYNILGLELGVSLKQIKKTYRKLAHVHHPDKVAHLGDGAVKQAEIVFRKIKDAYELIVRSLRKV